MSHQARASRSGRILAAIHSTGTAGLTVTELSTELEIDRYDVQELVRGLQRRRKLIKNGWRLLPGRQVTEEVYRCSARCTLPHASPEEATAIDYDPPAPLPDEVKQLGKAGIAQARQLLESIPDRSA